LAQIGTDATQRVESNVWMKNGPRPVVKMHLVCTYQVKEFQKKRKITEK
jgi:hypothetical protein